MAVGRIGDDRFDDILVMVRPTGQQGRWDVYGAAGHEAGEEVVKDEAKIAKVVDLLLEVAQRAAAGQAAGEYVGVLFNGQGGDQAAFGKANEEYLVGRALGVAEDSNEV